MGLKDAYEVTADNAKNLVKNPKAQLKRAAGALAELSTSGGMTGAAKEALAGRKSKIDEAVGYKKGGAVKSKASCKW